MIFFVLLRSSLWYINGILERNQIPINESLISFQDKTKKSPFFVKGRRFIYVRYTTCYIVRASLPIHESFNGDFRQPLPAYLPFRAATPEWSSPHLLTAGLPPSPVRCLLSATVTVSINVFNTDNHILGGINCQLIFLFFLDNLMHTPLCNTFLNLTYILQNIDRYFYTAFV